MKTQRLRSVLIFSTFTAAFVLTFFYIRNQPLSVTVAVPVNQVAINVYGLGTVEAKILSLIGFEAGATITELYADEGDTVKEGQVLARLHRAEQQAKTQQAAANIKVAEARLRKARATIPKMEAILKQKKKNNLRSQALLKRKMVSREEANEKQMEQDVAVAELNIALTEIRLAEAELADARAQYNYEKEILGHHELRAPYTGLVVKRHKELGAVLSPGEVVFTMIEPQTVWILGYVDEARAGHIHLDQPAQVRLRSLPDKQFHGKVARIDIESDRVSEERRVYIRCQDCPERLYLGEQAEIFIQTALLEDAVLVPETAIDHFDGSQGVVWVVQAGHLQRQPVTFGQKTLDGRIQITSGLEEDMQVVIKGAGDLKTGLSVSVEEGG